MAIPVRFPDAASRESVLAGLGPASADADLSLPSPARCRDLNSAWRASTTLTGATPASVIFAGWHARLPPAAGAAGTTAGSGCGVLLAGPTSLTASQGDGHGRHQRSLAAR